LKGDRCLGPKCAAARRAYAPGVHGKKRGGRGRPGKSSEFGDLQREKQKLRFFYGLDDRAVKRYVERASRWRGLFDANLIRMLESRLDATVRRLGFAPSAGASRQAVGHGHITVNGRTVRTASYETRKGDVIGLAPRAGRGSGFGALGERLAGIRPPPWLALDAGRRIGTVVGVPERDPSSAIFDMVKVKEFYSR